MSEQIWGDCQCRCSCWDVGQNDDDGTGLILCKACRMNIHSGDRPRPKPVLVADAPPRVGIADPIAFLAGCLRQDEAVAKDAPLVLDSAEWPFWIDVDDQAEATATAAYRDHFPPSRAIREVEAKRLILVEHRPYECGNPGTLRCVRCASDDAYPSGTAVQETWPCRTLRGALAIYADHSDYEPEWKP